MNIFYLDKDTQLCAQYHCDKHVIKMILEYAQILCTVLHKSGQSAPYRPTHINHPCVLWAEKSQENWEWLCNLARALNEEYKFRFDKLINHKSYDVILTLPSPDLPRIGLTERPQTMPDEYKVPGDPVAAYRHYYIHEKQKILTWRKRGTPWWYPSSPR